MRICLSILIFFTLININAVSCAQESETDTVSVSWDKNLRLRLFMNHIYQENWAKGGDKAFNWKADIDSDFARKTDRTTWDTIIRLRYEQSHISGQENRINQNEFDIRSAFIIRQRKYVNPFVGATMKTQITTGYKYFSDLPREPRSAFRDPVSFTQNLGIDISGIPDTKMRLSVDYSQKIADKYVQYYSIDDVNTEKIEKVKTTKSTTLWGQYSSNIKDKVSVKMELEAQYAFMHYSTTKVDFLSYIDFKIVSFLNFGIQSQFRFDKEQSVKRQFKSSIGLTFAFDLFKKN